MRIRYPLRHLLLRLIASRISHHWTRAAKDRPYQAHLALTLDVIANAQSPLLARNRQKSRHLFLSKIHLPRQLPKFLRSDLCQLPSQLCQRPKDLQKDAKEAMHRHKQRKTAQTDHLLSHCNLQLVRRPNGESHPSKQIQFDPRKSQLVLYGHLRTYLIDPPQLPRLQWPSGIQCQDQPNHISP